MLLLTMQLTTILPASLYASTNWADLYSMKYISPASTSTDMLQYSSYSVRNVYTCQKQTLMLFPDYMINFNINRIHSGLNKIMENLSFHTH